MDRDNQTDKWLTKIRTSNPDALIDFENYRDFEPLKLKFKYITKNRVASEITMQQASLSECCECLNDCISNKKCCSSNENSMICYDSKKLFINVGLSNLPIIECSKLCKCGPECANRVVQLGSKIPLCLFKSDESEVDEDNIMRVKTMANIHKGQFISEYVGKVIDFKEAELRRKTCEGNSMDFVYDMNFFPTDSPYSIDATYFGNAMRFIRHSDTPNCGVYSVWYDCVQREFPKLAFFALKNIRKDTELTMSYT